MTAPTTSPFLPRKDLTCLCPPERETQVRKEAADHLRTYRRYRARAGLPPIRLDRDYDHYTVDSDEGQIFVHAEFEMRPSVGGWAFRLFWTAEVETWHSGSRDHPPESDSMPLCSSPHLIDTVFAALSILRLENLRRTISEDAMAEFEMGNINY